MYLYFNWKSDRLKHAHGVSKFFRVFKVFLSCFSKTVPTAPRLGKVLKTMHLRRFSEVRRGLSVEKDLTGLLNTSIVNL